jgi:hypothetical protein
MKKPTPSSRTVKYRKYKTIDLDNFKADIKNSELYTDPKDNLDDMMCQYNMVLAELLNKHAPIQEKDIKVRSEAPWYTDCIRSEKQKRRKYEKKWRRSQLEADRQEYKNQCVKVNDMLLATKTDYYSNLVQNSIGQKELFKIVDNLLHRKVTSPLPKHASATVLANQFADYFEEKIINIRTSLQTSQDEELVDHIHIPYKDHKLSKFELTTEEEVRKIVMHAATKTCALDPIPTWLLKDSIDALLPIITKLINMSLLTGEVPVSMKEALVIPLLKKLILDCEIFKNYRPVSNLGFLSKVTEKIVSVRTSEHTSVKSLDEKYQSAYKPLHSTETALLCVHNDLLLAADEKKASLLVLLDLSAAFDTIDHGIMISTLEETFGINGTALKWYQSYMRDRTQSVVIDGIKSEPKVLRCGVPQGSILGPEMFTKYTKPLGDIIKKYGIKYHIYADDTQLYIIFDTIDTKEATENMENCINEIRNWMRSRWLKLNDAKTEVLTIGSKHVLSNLPPTTVHIGTEAINPTCGARNIGVHFNKHLDMTDHVNNICRAANFHIRNIRQIRKFLTKKAAEQLVHSFITSKLDYANSLLYGIPNKLIAKLQKVQNTAARVVCLLPKHCHITEVLQNLHWLPVKKRIQFKMMLLTYKGLNGLAPSYISNLLTPYAPNRKLRSCDCNLLQEKRSRTKTYGDRAFEIAAPRLWNKLPLVVQNSSTLDIFKQKLKTFLFSQK